MGKKKSNKKMSSTARLLIHTEKGFAVLFRKHGKKTIAQLPGGRAEKNETSRECVLREVSEEVSLSFSKSDLIFVTRINFDREHDIQFFRLKREIEVNSNDLEIPEKEQKKFKEGIEYFTSLKDLMRYCLDNNFHIGWGIYDFLEIHEQWSSDEKK